MGEAIYWYAVASVLLFFKMFAVSAYQGFYRIGKMTFKTPEDAAFVGRAAAGEELPQVQRAARAWLNDLENIPIFLALGVAYVWVGASPGAAAWLFLTFTGARYLHTVFYLSGLQPWRTVAYAVGVVCLFGMSVQIILALP
ncbi:glutathione metabolism protein [Alkalilimnicola ehrlichii]|uniref:Microsomal glutathione S-transferase 1 n=1 Tax=Alkalilimnicola ehrlichii TaxID=351052 RepID=A0A3E0WKC4_9GAMM|nr:MAPEG family protein [Alkalilimnicola ehrlichii]RFA26253.1 glutathione metabolism protein [Alkalilimnicola ehrlichii]RFA33238.1 glutathione metabolism protein [Alkalilimnicola ehrlichii]